MRRSGKGGQHAVRPFKKKDYDKIMRILHDRMEADHDDPIKYYVAYRNYMIFRIGVNVGLRQSDLMRLTPDSVADGTISYTAKKTGKQDSYDLNHELYKEIREYIATFKIGNNEYLFRGVSADHKHLRSGHLSKDRLEDIIKQLAKQINIRYPVNTHSLRKSYAMWLYEKTESIPIVQQALQHSSPNVTMHYLGISSEELFRVRKKINFEPDLGEKKKQQK